MRKLTTLFLSLCAIISVSCSNMDPDLSQSASGNPADLITTNGSGSTGSMTAVASFINKYKGVYYDYNAEQYGVVRYKLRNGRVDIVDGFNRAKNIIGQPVEAVLPSANKLQISNYADGTIEVLNLSDTGLESYTSYILEKVSDEVLIKNEGVGGYIEEFAKYKGTYNSIAKDNKIENYIAIDEKGYIFFHDENVKVAGGRVGITEGEGLTIFETYKEGDKNTLRKIIFKFDQGVYRRYSIDGQHRDLTYIGVCEVTKDFIEDIRGGNNLIYKSGRKLTDKWTSKGYGEFDEDINLNEPFGGGGIVSTTGSACVSGKFYSESQKKVVFSGRSDMVANITILKGKDLYLMGPYYNAKLTFNDDYSELTHQSSEGTIVFKLVSEKANSWK